MSLSTRNEQISGRLRVVLEQLFPTATLKTRAVELGVHVNSLGKYVQGERIPSTETLLALARWGADATWILTGEGTPFTSEDEQRKARLRDVLARVSDRALASEWERRLNEAIAEGTALLTEVRQRELEPMAKQLRAGELRPSVKQEAVLAMVLVRRAYRSFDRVAWWFGEVDKTLQADYVRFLELHQRVTNDSAFRTLLYEAGADVTLRSFLEQGDRIATLVELTTGKNLGLTPRRSERSAQSTHASSTTKKLASKPLARKRRKRPR